jgi:hypothetical protein
MRIEKPDISNYFINYQEHGMIEKATLTDSIAHVINHENRHIDEFEDYARFHNKDIVSENITISYKFIDGKIVAVAGKATALMKEKQPDTKSLTDTANNESTGNQSLVTPANNLPENQKIDGAINRIESALAKIETEIGKTENESADDNESTNALTQTKPDKALLEAKRRALASKLNKLKSEKMKKTFEELLQGVEQLFEDAANIMKAINGLKAGNENYPTADKNNKVKVPDYSMQYTGLMLDAMM